MSCPETIGTLITAGLARASNPGISTEALAFAKRLFRHWYTTKDLSFNLATASVSTTNTHEISLSSLTTFRSAYLLKLTTIAQPLEEKNYKDIWPKIQEDVDNSCTGSPTCFITEEDRTKILLWPRPNTSLSGTLKYYSAPATSSWTTATYPEYEDALAIETAIAEWAMNYDKEPMGVLVTRLTEQLQAEYENRHEPHGRASQTQLRWSPSRTRIKGD